MFFSKPSLLSKILLLCSFLIVLISCGSNNSGDDGDSNEGDSEGKTPVVIEDSEDAFSAVGISNIDELKSRVANTGVMALTVEIQNTNENIPSEKTIGLLKANNRNIEYKKLENIGIGTDVIGKLKKLRYSPVSVEQSIQLPNPEIFPMPLVTVEALALLNQDKLKKFNRKLRLAGQTEIGIKEFLGLQKAFSQVSMVNNFGILDQQFQNILARDTIDRSKSQVKSSSVSERLKAMTPTGYLLVNAVDEIQKQGSAAGFPVKQNACRVNRLNLPLQIAQSTEPINTNLVTSDSGDATVVFPETGIAVIVVAGLPGEILKIIGSNNADLDERTLAETGIYYLPITQDDLCKPFIFEGASEKFDVTLVEMIKPERINEHVFSNGSEYISSISATELINENGSFNVKSYSFSTIQSALPKLDIVFQWDTSDGQDASFDFMLHAPNGDLYSGTQTSAGPIEFDAIGRQLGIWQLDILPKGSVTTDNNNVIISLAPETPDVNQDLSFRLTTLVSTDIQIQTKEFVLGTLKNVSFKTQGETGTYDEGEVTINLNTSMSPKFKIPSYIEDVIASGDEMNQDIALWQCWNESDKNGTEFLSGEACYDYSKEFLRKQELYEELHSYDHLNDPQYYRCRDQDGDEAECIRGELGPYNMQNPTDAFKVQMVMNNYSKDMQRQYHDVEYLNILSNYYDLYQNWKERTVQVDSGKFPYDGLPYKTHEFTGCDPEDSECLSAIITGKYPRIPVIIETNRPVFGVPVERVNESTLPISFDYTASDQDVYNANSANWAFLNFVASQALNAVTGNFVGMFCDTVGLVDDLHDVELAAQDDPLGSARASINRYSSSDPFYGLHNQDSFRFFMSGVPEENTEIDTYGQKINYAQIACGVAGLATSGYQFASNTDLLLNLDYEQLGDAADVYRVIAGTSTAVGSALIMAEAEEIAALIREGNIEEAKQRLKTSSSVNNLTTGKDLYDDLDSLLAGYQAEGSAGNGNNVLKSSAKYLLGADKKTRAEVEFERISSVPVSRISVALNRVKIISNYETDDKAEINLIPFVGIISDKPRSSEMAHTLFSDTEDIRDGNHPWNYLYFGNVADGQTLETPNTTLYSESSCGNVAAVYVELAIKEEDSLSLEDDDMIGVFSQTIKLEEIFNKNAEFEWTSLGGNEYQLVITDYPVYNSSNQLSLENPLSEHYERQKAHNNQREPSALVTLTINLTMSDLNTTYPVTDTSLNIGVIGSGSDTHSMEMKTVGEITIDGSLLDVFKSKAIVGDESDRMVTGNIISYGAEPYFLTKLFSYNIHDLTGDLAPIKEALTSTNSTGRKFRDSTHEVVYELSMVQLLKNNRLLFVISHDGGARIMIVNYTNDGVMTLAASVLIKDAAENQVYSLLHAALSPDRTRLMVPYVSTDYAGTDKQQPAYTRLNLYEIGDDNTITRLSTNSLGNGEPITRVKFIDESHVAVLKMKLSFGSEGPAWYRDWEAVQESCTSANLDCLFEVVGRDLLLLRINESSRLELTDSLDVFYTPPHERNRKDYYPLKDSVFGRNRTDVLSLVSNIENASSILRYVSILHQLNYDGQTEGYYFGDSSAYQNTRSVRYNSEGKYYCADGITCSGYLKSALKPSRDGTDYYTSEAPIRGFEFADIARDLVLGFSGDKLQLLSLYNGAAYKGPQITGDILDTDVSINGSDSKNISFTVTDRDTPLDQLSIEVTASTVTGPVGYQATHISAISCIVNENDEYICSGTISTDAFDDDITLVQTVNISVSDGAYTTERMFTLYHNPSILIPFADANNGIELWKTDGSGSSILNDANPTGDSLSFYSGLYKSGSQYFYTGDNGDGKNQPFVATTDGEAKPLKIGITDGSYSTFATFGDHVYFSLSGNSDDSILWKTDGTSDGTVQVKTIASGQITQFFNFNNALYFFVNGDSGAEDELWMSDGTTAGTKIVKGSLNNSTNSYAAVSNGKLFFTAKAFDGSDIGLWVTDGTTSGTQLFHELSEIPSKLTDVNGTLYYQVSYQDFDAQGDSISHLDLWKTDGTVIGTLVVKETQRIGNTFNLKQMFVADNELYFVKDDALWKSDGTGGGTEEVEKLYTLPDFNQLKTPIKVVNNIIYFNIQRTNPFGYSLYAMAPSTSNALITVDSTRYEKLFFNNESLGNNLIYTTEDDTNYYLWKHNIDDGKTLIKQTGK